MQSEKNHKGKIAVLRVIAVGRAESIAPADLGREFPERSSAEFQRFSKAVDESDPTARARRRARITRTLLALALIGLVGLTLSLLKGRMPESTLQSADVARLKRQVCQAAMGFTRQQREPLESACPVHP